MLSGSDVALMRLAAYADQPAPGQAYNGVAATGYSPPLGLPAGFVPITAGALGLSLGPMPIFIHGAGMAYDSYDNGLFINVNSAALVTVGVLNGVTTATLAFRGAIAESDSVNDFKNINAQYTAFAELITAFDALVAKQGITQVAVTGQGLGGAMAQIYMSQHADTAATRYIADTFGSPGALIAAGTDTRIANVQIADDPAVYLGQNRVAVGAALQADPTLAGSALLTGSTVYPGLTATDVTNAIPSLTTNYVNRGTTTLLPNADGSLTTINSLAGAQAANAAEPLATTYLARVEAAANSVGNDQVVPGITPTTTGVQVYRFFDERNGTQFFTASAGERDAIRNNLSLALYYEGVGLNADNPATDARAIPVFRFFDSASGSHFYTASVAESATIQSTRPDLAFEGTAFYENATPQANDTAVYRFFDTQNGTHFFTADLTEYASVIATRPDLVAEGVAFYTQKS